jgi:hypothetical protein
MRSLAGRHELDDGRRLRAETAIVADGAFAVGSDLLPAPVALRAKSEVYAIAELDDQQAAKLDAMPCVNRTIERSSGRWSAGQFLGPSAG